MDARLKMEVHGSNLFSGVYFVPGDCGGWPSSLGTVAYRRYKWISVAALLLFCVNPIFSFVYGGRSVVAAVGVAAISWLLVVPAVLQRHMACMMGLLSAVFIITMYHFVAPGREGGPIGRDHHGG
jgi:hypothetical protein